MTEQSSDTYRASGKYTGCFFTMAAWAVWLSICSVAVAICLSLYHRPIIAGMYRTLLPLWLQRVDADVTEEERHAFSNAYLRACAIIEHDTYAIMTPSTNMPHVLRDSVVTSQKIARFIHHVESYE